MSDSATPQVGHPSTTIAKAISALVTAKTTGNRRPKYVLSLRYYLEQFARGREDTPLSEITVDTIERWFNERNEALTTRRGSVGRLSSLFSFAERRGWLVHNPVKRLEKLRIDQKPPKILTVDQAQRLMEFATNQHPRSLAFFALALFAGVRPMELEQVTWENVGATTVTIAAAASKVRRRRIVHLRESAIEWIKFAREMGAELPLSGNARKLILQKAAQHLGFEGWPQDVCRHSAASFWLALSSDVSMVAKELGNSPAVLLTYYAEIVTAEEANMFWSLRPNWLAALEHRWNAPTGELSLIEKKVLDLHAERWAEGEIAHMLGLTPAAVARVRREAMRRMLVLLTHRASHGNKEKQAAVLHYVVNHEPKTRTELGIPLPTLDRMIAFVRAKMDGRNEDGKTTGA